ncbi:MAG: sugar-binding protein [Bacteroidota bacterium]
MAQDTLLLPQLVETVTIDGDLSEWKEGAFHDGLWDLHRLKHSSWYEANRNRLADHGESASLTEDLQARYFLAWDSLYLYLGAEVWDNVNDTAASKPGKRRWYYRDAIAFFIEAPGDTVAETFGAGDHGFAFTADATRPASAAWWRHGTPDTTFVEKPLPTVAVDYHFQFDSWGRSPADYVLEARIRMDAVLPVSDPEWEAPAIGHLYRLMIVHCDPDGGAYGGHLLIYGRNDSDASWTPLKLVGPTAPIIRKDH